MYNKLQKFCLTCRKEKFQFLFLIPLLIFSCDDHCPATKNDKIFIPSGTTSILLEFKSTADGNIIPVYLALPSSQSSLLKAVVVLHGSGGPWDDDDTNGDGIGDVCNVGSLSKQNKEWEALLISHSYAVAFPDSYSPRNTCENEGDYKFPPLKFQISGTFVRNHDAQGVLQLLEQLTWKDSDAAIIDINNVALIGFSDGGTALLSSVYDESSAPASWSWKQSFDGVTYTKEILPPIKRSAPGFKAAVVYYPGAYHNGYYGNLCNATGIYKAYCDIVFHLAGNDPLTENSECLISTMNKLGGGEPLVYRYENADHGFDSNDEPESKTARTHTLLYINEKLGQ
jgi:dienelactone hydrolase